jgi:drug/metabolite transporter (DMT)-like permease
MTGWVVALVLLSALMHAGWNFLVKRGDDSQLDTALFAMGCSLIAAALLPWVTLPDPSCYPWLAVSLMVHVAYFWTLAAAYQHADLSLAYPLMRGMAPVMVALFASVSGESMSALQLLGVALIASGIVAPAWAGKPWTHRKGLYFALLNAAIIALYTVLDGIGVRKSGHAVSYTLWLFLFNSWGILSILIWRRSMAEVIQQARVRWRLALLGAGLSMGSYGIVLWAMTQSAIPAVAALREVSVIFAALLGAWFLKESMGRWRIVGASLVGVGAAVIRFS